MRPSRMEKIFPPEIELLLCCARTAPDLETVTRIRALVGAGLNWQAALAAAQRHCIIPLLYWQLKSVCPDHVPLAELENLRERFYRNNEHNLLLTKQLIRLSSRFNSSGIPNLVYKGPLLATAAFGNLALRQFLDLDFLVSENDVPRAREVLTSLGYELQGPHNLDLETAFLRSRSEYSFARTDGKCTLDLHWRILPEYFSVPLDFGRLWRHRKAIAFGGSEIMTFSPEDSVLFLCVHGAKHVWARIEWIASLSELLQTHRETLNWDFIMQEAGRLRIERMVLLGLAVAYALLQTPVADHVRRQAQTDPVMESLYHQVVERISDVDSENPGIAESILFHVKTREHFPDRIRYLFRLMTTPSGGDWALICLPKPLFPLYYLIHPFRFLAQYGLRAWRRS